MYAIIQAGRWGEKFTSREEALAEAERLNQGAADEGVDTLGDGVASVYDTDTGEFLRPD